MRLAAVDIGTNSVHMIIASLRADGSFEVINREKEVVRLGAGGLDGRPLDTGAMAAALDALSRFKRLADSHRVDQIVAVATSAVREAPDGEDFLRLVARRSGMRPRLISGTEEAALIHRAALHGVGGSGVTVVVDIGGGSVEVTRGASAEPESACSLKLGVIRLTERFVRTDPLSAEDEGRLVGFIEREAGETLDSVARAGFTRVIGTSGTIQSLGALIAARQGTSPPRRNRRISANQIASLRARLTALPIEGRLREPKLNPRRADLIVAGVVLLDVMVRRLGAPEITICDLSLREGLILDYASRHARGTDVSR
jgi:exopolyphosphatase/guanosine-5'-triphosphate,3'-diphosphate pyrophosphatase